MSKNCNSNAKIDSVKREIEYSKMLLILLNGEAISSMGKEKANEKLVLLKFLKGESLRSLSNIYSLDRERIAEGLRELFSGYPQELAMFDQIIESRKASSTIEVDEKDLQIAVRDVLFNGKTQKEAYESLKLDPETFRVKMLQVINNNHFYRSIYIQREAKRRPDYSFINFKALLLEMIRSGKTQSEIGEEYGIPARRISREIENLPEEDKLLRKACKMQARISWKRLKENKLEKAEKLLLDEVLEKYSNVQEPIIIENPKSKKQSELERVEEILKIADSVDGTNKEKASAAGVSVSTLRRAKIKYEMSSKKSEQAKITNLEEVEK